MAAEATKPRAEVESMNMLRIVFVGLVIATLAAQVGCTSAGATTDTAALQADRALLAKFVGAWDYQGWSQVTPDVRRESKGRAAGVIERTHFLLLDTESIITQGGKTRKLEGSILFSVEPGEGLMLT